MSEEEKTERPACAHCGAPFDQGHAPDCPVLVRHREKYTERPESRGNNRFEVSRERFSRERLDDLRHGFERLQAEKPECLAFGLVGSMVHGRATNESDIDGFLFLDANEVLLRDEEASIETVTSEYLPHTGLVSTTRFDDNTARKYIDAFKETVIEGSDNITAEHLRHPLAVPVSREIIDHHVDEFVDLINRFADWQEKRREREEFLAAGGSEDDAPAVPERPDLMQISPNLVSLFHLQLGHGLDQYRDYLINRLSDMNDYGKLIWKGIGRSLETFEQGTITNKKYPRTLEDAREKYLSIK